MGIGRQIGNTAEVIACAKVNVTSDGSTGPDENIVAKTQQDISPHFSACNFNLIVATADTDVAADETAQ
ncbi:hypothetical protein D3C80_2002000 [compost metagenome]